MHSIIADTIQSRLGMLGITITRTNQQIFPGHSYCDLHFVAVDVPYVICCYQHRVIIYDQQSLCGEYFYADPDFYVRLVKRVRMLVNPTSIWHICQAGSSIGMPSILDE